MRGALAYLPGRTDHRGLIPARAGNTACYLWASGWTGAHPRSRGEHMGFPSVPSLDMGSSPPVRGAHVAYRRYEGRAGLIPARAGSTEEVAVNAGGFRAHPRPCGEHHEGWAYPPAHRGSSPPVRGAHREEMRDRIIDGLIPARAGSTFRRTFR